MSRDGAFRHFVADEAGRHEVLAETSGIEPFLQRGHRAVMVEHSAVPDALERRHLVEACSLSGLERQVRIGSYGHGHHIRPVRVIWWQAVALSQRELVVGVEGRSMAAGASFPLEYSPAGSGPWIGGVRIRRRLERKEVLGQREEQLV